MGLSLSAPIRSAAPVRRGGIRAAAGSPSPGIGSRNGGGVGVPKLPALIAIAGYTGSGKTSLAKMLVRRLDFQMVVLSTTRSPAANEVEGVDYNFLDEKTFMEGLQSGEIIGCEGGYGAYYGVSRSQLEDIITSGKSGAVVVGASLMDSLRADLAPRGDVRFRSVLVRLPGTPQQRYDEIVRRIEKRAAEEGRDAADRLAKVSLDALQAYDGRADYFDFELENGDFKAAGQAMRDYVETVWEGGTTGKTERVLIRNTPEVNLGRYLLRRLEEKIDQALDQIDLSSYESIRAGVDEHLSEELLALLTSVLREYHGESAMAGHMQESLARTHRHILNVAICILQNKEQLAQLMEEKMGLGKLAAIEDTSRARANLERLLAISGRYSTKHLLWLALLHDVTKMASLHLHPERSYELLDRFSLFKELAWSAEDKNIYRVALRYHILLTACFMPDLSAQAFVDFLKDPQVQQLLAPLGVVDAVTAEKLLDSILLLTVADVASYGPALTNFKVELILRHRNMIL